MAGIAQGFFEALAHSASKGFRHSGSATGSVKGNHWGEAVHEKVFRFGQRLNYLDLAVAQDFCRFHILIDQTFDAEHKLIVKRRLGFFWKAADIKLERIRFTAHPTDEFAGQNRSHS